MKKSSLVFLSLALCLSLAACKKEAAPVEMTKAKPNTTQELTEKDTKENNLEDIEKETKKDDALNNGTEAEKLNALLEKSDYISLVELSSTADNQMELRILNNYKGNLSNIEFDAPKNLSPNKQYLIFYHDQEDGSIVPTNGNSSVIEVKDSEDKVLAKVQDKYASHEIDRAENAEEAKKSSKEDTSPAKKESSPKKTADTKGE